MNKKLEILLSSYIDGECEHPEIVEDMLREDKKAKEIEKISRQNFIEACHLITTEDEKAFENVWRKLALSVDWSLTYTTIGNHCRLISQLSFLDLVEKGMVYNTESVTMWDTDFRTAVAQDEVEDREVAGAYHDLRFGIEDGEEFVISTTRPASASP